MLAADAAQHPQPGDGIGASPISRPASSRWCACRRCSGRTMKEEGDRGPGRRRGRGGRGCATAEKDDRHDDVADDGPTIRAKTSNKPPRRIASEATTATTSPVASAGERLADVGAVPADQLDRAERRPQPVVHREPAPPRRRARLTTPRRRGRATRAAGPGPGPRRSPGRWPGSSRRGTGPCDHPQYAEAGRDRERTPRPPAHPAQEAQRAAQVRGARMLVRKAHEKSRYARSDASHRFSSGDNTQDRSASPARRTPDRGVRGALLVWSA